MKDKEKNPEENHKLIDKFVEDTCNYDEATTVIQWFNDPSYRMILFQTLRKLWYRDIEKEKKQEAGVNLAPTLDKIHHRINIDRESEVFSLQKRTRIYRIFLRVAVVLILPLLVTSILFVHEKINIVTNDGLYTELSVAPGSKLRTVLPDGTVVWLNSGSTLKYPQSFSCKNRQAILTGEAYFDVKPDRLHPFLIKTEGLDLNVIGTSFNVMAYPDEKNISVTLEEGRISVENPGSGKNISRLCFLEPKEQIVFQKETGTAGISNVNTDQFTSWKDGRLIFRNNTLDFIFNRLERWYNTEIEIVGVGNLPQVPYTLTIEDETIIQVLEYLSVASGLSYEVIPSKKQENGRISTTKYVISDKTF
ncbi:MAG: FecR domain-containing protein [Bacteroidales bacterium]|nr:FecR domain-containing protein [Bacteroidales bacterium]